MGYFGLSVAISDKIMQRLLVLLGLWHAFHFPMSVLSIKRFCVGVWSELVLVLVMKRVCVCACVLAFVGTNTHVKLFLWLSHFNKQLVFRQTGSQPQPSRVPTLDLWKKTTADRWQPIIILLQLHNPVVHMRKAHAFLIYGVFLKLCIYPCFPQLVSRSFSVLTHHFCRCFQIGQARARIREVFLTLSPRLIKCCVAWLRWKPPLSAASGIGWNLFSLYCSQIESVTWNTCFPIKL